MSSPLISRLAFGAAVTMRTEKRWPVLCFEIELRRCFSLVSCFCWRSRIAWPDKSPPVSMVAPFAI